MARTDLPVQTIGSSGVAVAYTAANAQGHSVSNDGKVITTVRNGGGSSITCTAQTPGTVDGLAVADKTYTIGAGAELSFALPPVAYNQPDSSTDAGKVYLDFSSVTSVTIAAIRAA